MWDFQNQIHQEIFLVDLIILIIFIFINTNWQVSSFITSHSMNRRLKVPTGDEYNCMAAVQGPTARCTNHNWWMKGWVTFGRVAGIYPRSELIFCSSRTIAPSPTLTKKIIVIYREFFWQILPEICKDFAPFDINRIQISKHLNPHIFAHVYAFNLFSYTVLLIYCCRCRETISN